MQVDFFRHCQRAAHLVRCAFVSVKGHTHHVQKANVAVAKDRIIGDVDDELVAGVALAMRSQIDGQLFLEREERAVGDVDEIERGDAEEGLWIDELEACVVVRINGLRS